MDKKIDITSIPKEKFAFASREGQIKDQKFEDKPIGYFKDAWIRFCKNKASIAAALIIIAIVLFAVIVPFLNSTGTGTYATTRYSRKVPRNLSLSKVGIATGNVEREYNEKTLINFVALGIDSLANYDAPQTVGEAISSGDALQPVSKIKDTMVATQGKNKNTIYTVDIDNYLEVGFAYMDIDKEEYEAMQAWQEQNGIQLLYPMIQENEYNFAITNSLSENANWWYKTDDKGTPVKIVKDAMTGEDKAVPIRYDSLDELTLVDNYLRDEEGNLRYFIYSGGGSASDGTAMYRVRVLFYNYYRYTHDGAEPEFIFGTDSIGYDLAYRMAIGIRLSLLLSVCIFAINFVLGAMYGAIEGYYGGNTDLIMEFISYVLSGVPFMVVATLFQMHLAGKVGPIPSLLFAFVLTGWIGTASGVRTQFYRFKNQEYVMAARTLGARDRRVIWKHIFPNTLGTIITSSVLAIPGVIFSESMLSYLGIINLGSEKSTSLGTLLSDAANGNIWTSAPHLMIFPALIISLLMICFNLFGNGLRDAFNPSLRGVEE